MLRIIPVALALAVAFASFASAGSQESPELTDPEGDAACYGPLGNEYADIVSAWIDGETATSLMVHIAIAKWTADALGTGAGYTLQFSHQGVQYGAIAAYIPEPMGGGWEFNNGYVDTASGELSDFQDAQGSFTPGTPAIISIEFSKSMFPHGDSNDNKLVGLTGGSADLKNWAPFLIADVEPPVPFQICDSIQSSAEYVFQMGGHSAGPAPEADAGQGTANPSSANGTSESGGPVIDDAVTVNASGNDTPFFPAAGILLVVALVAVLRRR